MLFNVCCLESANAKAIHALEFLPKEIDPRNRSAPSTPPNLGGPFSVPAPKFPRSPLDPKYEGVPLSFEGLK